MKKGIRSKYRPEYPAEFKFDYKDPVSLGRFLMEGGRIIPARISKLSLSQQHNLARAVKKARNLALLPVGSHAYDTYGFPTQISSTPFEI